ncbi:MAG: DNA polymerase ligase N-terminal domain-containing protein [Planctomycetota bacterium]
MPTPRYVILLHRTADGEHWDFMLETGAALATWQLAAEPTGPAGLPLAATRLADHRKAYLDYEGQLSRNRGAVSRVDTGVYRLVRQDEDRWEFELAGGRLTGRFAFLRQPDGEQWQFILR